MLAALDDVDLDRRRFINAQHPVIVEVRLLHPAFLDRDLAPQRRGQAEDQPALKLRHNGVGVDGNAGVDGAGDTPQMHGTHVIDLGFNHRRNEAAEGRLRAHATADAGRQRLAPAGFLGDELERGLQPRRAVEHIVVRADAAPEAGGHGGRLAAHILNAQVRDVVGDVDRAIHRVEIDVMGVGRRQPARDHRRAGEMRWFQP